MCAKGVNYSHGSTLTVQLGNFCEDDLTETDKLDNGKCNQWSMNERKLLTGNKRLWEIRFGQAKQSQEKVRGESHSVKNLNISQMGLDKSKHLPYRF